VDYFTLEGRIVEILNLHMEIMMHFMGKELNFAYFLSHSLKHLVERVKASKYGIPIHQVLINLIYNRVLDSIPH